MATLDTLWYTRCPVPTPLGIATHLGWVADEFKKDEITVRTLQDETDASLRESHYDHHLANSFRQGGNIPAIWARAAKRATRVVGLTWTDEAQVLLTLPETKIRTLKDLRGRKLGVVVDPTSPIDFWRATTLRAYFAALKLEGLSEADVKIVDLVRAPRPLLERGWQREPLAQSREATALRTGEVDVIFHKGSRGLELASEIGATVLFDVGAHPDPKVRVNNGSPRTLTVDQALLDSRPDVVARLVKTVIEAGRWAEANPEEAVRFVASETGSSEGAVLRAYGGEVHRHLKTDLEISSIEALSDFKDFLFSHGFLENDFDVRSWIAHEPLEAARRALAGESASVRPRPVRQGVATGALSS